jgi:hypothetical protein
MKAAGLQSLPQSNSPASREPGEDRQKDTTRRPVQDTTERRDRTYLANHHASLSLSPGVVGHAESSTALGRSHNTAQRSTTQHRTAEQEEGPRSVGGRGEKRAHDIRRAASLGPVPQIFACGQ